MVPLAVKPVEDANAMDVAESVISTSSVLEAIVLLSYCIVLNCK